MSYAGSGDAMRRNRRKVASIGLLVLGLVALAIVPAAVGQQSSAGTASARQVTASSGRPSAFEIEQNIINRKIAELQRQVNEAQRCIETASMPQILTDPQGNINRVPQTDIVNCTRQLEQLERQLVSLQRQAAQLSRDAAFQASQLQGLLRLQQIRQRTQQPGLQTGP